MRFESTDSYIATEDLRVAVNAAAVLERPLLIKGEPGTGKTVLAHEVARSLEMPLIEWHVKSTTTAQQGLYEYDAVARLRDSQLGDARVHDIANYIVKGKMWEAFESAERTVLLIDEIDKADEEFEALLLEILSDFQISIPEIGTIVATVKPLVFLTSNNTREMSDALKRRCLHLHIAFPDRKTEAQIVAARVPQVPEALNDQLVRFVQALRALDLRKSPSVAETIDWARTLLLMHAKDLNGELVRDTLNVLLNFEDDIDAADRAMPELLRHASGAVMTP